MNTYASILLIILFFSLYGFVWFIIHTYQFIQYLINLSSKSGFKKVASTKHFKEIRIKE